MPRFDTLLLQCVGKDTIPFDGSSVVRKATVPSLALGYTHARAATDTDPP